MTLPDQTLEQPVRDAIVRALGLPCDPTIPLKMGVTPGWDSMGHMRVVLEVERALRVTFPTYALPRLVDVTSILRVLSDLRR
jgi:acyl carrier protein